jgi:hypothetical protein
LMGSSGTCPCKAVHYLQGSFEMHHHGSATLSSWFIAVALPTWE